MNTIPAGIRYEGNGRQISFFIPFPYASIEDIAVKTMDADLTESVCELETDYRIADHCVVFNTAPASGISVFISLEGVLSKALAMQETRARAALAAGISEEKAAYMAEAAARIAAEASAISKEKADNAIEQITECKDLAIIAIANKKADAQEVITGLSTAAKQEIAKKWDDAEKDITARHAGAITQINRNKEDAEAAIITGLENAKAGIESTKNAGVSEIAAAQTAADALITQNRAQALNDINERHITAKTELAAQITAGLNDTQAARAGAITAVNNAKNEAIKELAENPQIAQASSIDEVKRHSRGFFVIDEPDEGIAAFSLDAWLPGNVNNADNGGAGGNTENAGDAGGGADEAQGGGSGGADEAQGGGSGAGNTDNAGDAGAGVDNGWQNKEVLEKAAALYSAEADNVYKLSLKGNAADIDYNETSVNGALMSLESRAAALETRAQELETGAAGLEIKVNQLTGNVENTGNGGEFTGFSFDGHAHISIIAIVKQMIRLSSRVAAIEMAKP